MLVPIAESNVVALKVILSGFTDPLSLDLLCMAVCCQISDNLYAGGLTEYMGKMDKRWEKRSASIAFPPSR